MKKTNPEVTKRPPGQIKKSVLAIIAAISFVLSPILAPFAAPSKETNLDRLQRKLLNEIKKNDELQERNSELLEMVLADQVGSIRENKDVTISEEGKKLLVDIEEFIKKLTEAKKEANRILEESEAKASPTSARKITRGKDVSAGNGKVTLPEGMAQTRTSSNMKFPRFPG